MHIHLHRGWYYVIDGSGEVMFQSQYSWRSIDWLRANYGLEYRVEEIV